MHDIARVIERLHGPDAVRRAEAAEALCRMGTDASAAAIDLVRACGDDDSQVREWAAAALEDLGPPPAGSTGPLAELARGDDPLAAYWAVTLLGRDGQGAEPAVAVLIECLESSEDAAVRQRAAWALGKIGAAAAPAREPLRKAEKSEDPRLARLAKEALDSIGV